VGRVQLKWPARTQSQVGPGLCTAQQPQRWDSLGNHLSRWCPPMLGKVHARSINACLAPIGGLNGAAVTTAEGIGSSASGFHPVQGWSDVSFFVMHGQ
jgi:hypothetical protein